MRYLSKVIKLKTLNDDTHQIWGDFTNQYSLQKTIRFELKPIGKTREHIENEGLLKIDEKRAEDYKKVKKIIDRYHKKFIEEILSNEKLCNIENLKEFAELYYKQEKDKKDKEKLEEIRKELRKEIATAFSKNEKYELLFSEELFTQLLPGFVEEYERDLINEFNGFTTYFRGFYENRKNLYSDKEKSTAIAYRIVHDNLPKFLNNIKIYEKMKRNNIGLKDIEKELSEILKEKKLEDIFSINYFNHVLSQSGIDFYNSLLGGIVKENESKVKGINEYINLYNQQQKDKKNHISKMTPLYKQILSDSNNSSFVLVTFENDEELMEAINQFYESLLNYELDGKKQSVFTLFRNLFQNSQEIDSYRIYIRNDKSLTNISEKLFGDWRLIQNALNDWYYRHKLTKNKHTKKDLSEKEKWLKRNYISIFEIENALEEYENEAIDKSKCKGLLLNYFASFKNNVEDDKSIIQKIEDKYSNIKILLNVPYNKKNLASEKEDVAKIKEFLDALLDLVHFVKPLNLKEDIVLEKDEYFYNQYSPLFNEITKVIPLYNKARNYLTKKPYSIEKIKLTFENSTLLNGWDLNKEADNTSVLLRKNGLYYLAIMNIKHKNVFKRIPEVNQNEQYYEKMVYKLLPAPNKSLPKYFLSKKGINTFNPSKELLSKYNQKKHVKGDNFDINFLHELIDYFKECLKKYESSKHFNFNFSDTKDYNDISEFYKEVESQGYVIKFQKVSESFINELVNSGKIYLFQIYNKDFSPHSRGKPNMHTLYWKMLFDQNNLNDVVYKLNGEAEVFYRKKSLDINNTTVHKANKPINNKNPKNEKKQSVFEYDIVKNKRFTVDKFQFHVPITLNFKSKGIKDLNFKVRKFIKNNPNIKIIGIDRGERNLLYLTLINQNGEILLQESLNEIVNKYKDKNGKTYEKHTDYQSLLKTKGEEREEARKNWDIIENIMELKEGYLSNVVHYITKLMVENNAILVMEDLNFGFKRGRQKVEKQVYQKFEKALIDKLNYLVFKDKKPTEIGGLLKALQLTNEFKSFKDLGKQNGFIFYVPALYTSKIDPITGFVNLLNFQYENVTKAKSFFSKFKSITYNEKQDWFEFSFDYKDFTDKAAGKTDWVVCTTKEERFLRDNTLNNGKGGQKNIDVNSELKELFSVASISYKIGSNIKDQIVSQNSPDFFKKLMRLLSLVFYIRYNNGLKDNEEKDYILSPVEPFFNSLKSKPTEPKDADANGAYHIAKKGLWIIQKINNTENDDELKKVKLNISNKEWFEFAQNGSSIN
ncbi:MAG: type V CRISPR-associated protein Cas12a/Cpf1 [Candidatus Diapherotrites archaeon]